MLKADAAAPQITFSGSNTPGSLVVVHLRVKGSGVTLQVFYTTSGADNLNSIATAVAAKITGLASPGLSATATAAQVTVTGPSVTNIRCKIFGAHADNTWADVHTSVADGSISVSGQASSPCDGLRKPQPWPGQPT